MRAPLFARGGVTGLFSLSKREPGYFAEHPDLTGLVLVDGAPGDDSFISIDFPPAGRPRISPTH